MNSLFQELNQTRIQSPNNLSNIKNLMNTVKGIQNPQQMMATLAQSNPQLRNVLSLVQNSNMSPKDLFYKMAREKGVNPDDILKALQQ